MRPFMGEKEFTEEQVKDLITAIWGRFELKTGFDYIVGTGIHHILMEILYPETDKLEGEEYARALDVIQPEDFFPTEE